MCITAAHPTERSLGRAEESILYGDTTVSVRTRRELVEPRSPIRNNRMGFLAFVTGNVRREW